MCNLGRRYPDLLAMHDVSVTLAHGLGFQHQCVEPGVGFGHAEASLVLALNDRWQPARLLFVRPEHHDRVKAEDIQVQTDT